MVGVPKVYVIGCGMTKVCSNLHYFLFFVKLSSFRVYLLLVIELEKRKQKKIKRFYIELH